MCVGMYTCMCACSKYKVHGVFMSQIDVRLIDYFSLKRLCFKCNTQYNTKLLGMSVSPGNILKRIYLAFEMSSTNWTVFTDIVESLLSINISSVSMTSF